MDLSCILYFFIYFTLYYILYYIGHFKISEEIVITGFECVFSREISCFFMILSAESPDFTVLKGYEKTGYKSL